MDSSICCWCDVCQDELAGDGVDVSGRKGVGARKIRAARANRGRSRTTKRRAACKASARARARARTTTSASRCPVARWRRRRRRRRGRVAREYATNASAPTDDATSNDEGRSRATMALTDKGRLRLHSHCPKMVKLQSGDRGPISKGKFVLKNCIEYCIEMPF